MKWIIEHYGAKMDTLVAAAKGQGHEVVEVIAKSYFEFDKSLVKENECVIFQGSIDLTRKMKDYIPTCYPINWNNWKAFECTSYYPALGKHLFNDRYAMVSVAELMRQKWFYYHTFAKDTTMFVRPNDGDKSFTGQLIDLINFDTFWTNKISSIAKMEDLVVVSTPKNIKGEYRFVVSKKGIIAGSCYNYQGNFTPIPGTPQGAIDKCNEILSEGYYPDPVFVIDICEDNDGKYWLLELGSFSSSGLYACDVNKIVKEVSAIAQAEYDTHMIQKTVPL